MRTEAIRRDFTNDSDFAGKQSSSFITDLLFDMFVLL